MLKIFCERKEGKQPKKIREKKIKWAMKVEKLEKSLKQLNAVLRNKIISARKRFHNLL